MNFRVVIAVLLVLVLGGGITYYLLGGTRPVEVSVAQPGEYFMVGKAFEGRYTNPEMKENFRLARQYVSNGTVKGTLALVFYVRPEANKGQTKCFAGVLTDPKAAVPEAYELRIINAPRVVRATVERHNLVMPSPEAIREQIEAFAKEKNLQLSSEYTIEKIVSDWKVVVEVPLAN